MLHRSIIALTCLLFVSAAQCASAGITVGPAGTSIVALSTNLAIAEPGVSTSCPNATVVGTLPTAPNNTSLTNPIDVPILLYFGGTAGGGGTCSASFAGNTVPLSFSSLDTTPGDHILRVAQDHSLSIVLAGDMISYSIPALGCTVVYGAATLPVTAIGTLSMMTGFQMTNVTLPRLSDDCGLSGTSTLTASYSFYINTGTMLAPTHSTDVCTPGATLVTVTDLA